MAEIAHERIDSIMKDKKWLVSVNSSDSVQSVLGTLSQYNVTSVPIFDNQTKNFVSLVSTMDLVAFLAFDTYFKRHKKDEVKFEVHYPDLNKPIIDIMREQNAKTELHNPSMTITIDEHSTIRQVLEIFSQGVHRVIVGTSGIPEKTKILSQADLVLFLLDRFDKFPDALKEPLDKLGLVNDGRMTSKIVAMSSRNSALEGFRKIYRQGISAVAILEEGSDNLIGTLSASDIRGMKIEQLSLVMEPVVEYLHKKYPHPRPLVTVTAKSTLKEVLEKQILGKVHRVWIIDAHNHPIGVVTMTDAIRIIFNVFKKSLVHQ